MIWRVLVPAIVVTFLVHVFMGLLGEELHTTSYAMGLFAMVGIIIGNELFDKEH